jgi:hypothetical protein
MRRVVKRGAVRGPGRRWEAEGVAEDLVGGVAESAAGSESGSGRLDVRAHVPQLVEILKVEL